MASSSPINIPRPPQDHGTGAADAPAWYTSLMEQMKIKGSERDEYDIGDDGHSDIMDDYEFLLDSTPVHPEPPRTNRRSRSSSWLGRLSRVLFCGAY